REKLYREGCDRLMDLHTKLTGPTPLFDSTLPRRSGSLDAEQPRELYMDRVRQCQDYIGTGDIYQANLSHRFRLDLGTAAGPQKIGLSIYDRLRSVNPSPFSAVLCFDTTSLVSCSPERLLRLDGNRVETRPIAGTRPRGQSRSEDHKLMKDLLLNQKERAEHLMMVDLERSDLGRVCEFGTVQVDEFMTIEQYSHVSHLVSNVIGRLREDMNGFDGVKAVFPGGTITGVPKIRCMEIIEHLEPVRRGPYTGSLGYLSWCGDLDLNILIRTLVLSGRDGYLQVGAGIVADSDPGREYEETWYKAQAFFRALCED
ncbi:MAG: anthranilate synthase component I family protein, partial [Nitrospiraceae bacterium]